MGLVLCAPVAWASSPAEASAHGAISTTLLQTTVSWNGAPLLSPVRDRPEFQTVLVEIAPKSATAWHRHPCNNIAYILSGRLRIELEDGHSREFKEGDSFAETVDTWHRGVNLGEKPLRILVVYAGQVGEPLSVPKASVKAGN